MFHIATKTLVSASDQFSYYDIDGKFTNINGSDNMI